MSERPTIAAGDSAHRSMLQMIAGFGIAHAIFLAAELGLADLLKDVPRSSEDLAQATGTHAGSLRRLMRALVSAGVCIEDEAGRYALTSIGETLRSDVRGSLRAWARVVVGEESRRAWGNLKHSVRTGEIAFDNLFGTNVWDHRARHPDTAKIFDEAMGNLSSVYNSAVVATYPFSSFETIVDVGGGNGSFMMAVLQANARLKGVLVDLPHVAAKARQRIAEAGLAGRCEVVGGDAFTAVPEGGDAYALCRVIHDWDDDAAAAILQTCRRAMSKNATLLVIERMVADRVEHTPAAQSVAISDLMMMVMNGGRERSQAEYRTLFARAGFTLSRIVSTEATMNVVEGKPA